ncbi:hypothetical protein C900_03790 [Fulvivirga imtechensis AK7]|uniref:Uncharacterized protein n=1 Tax=Fulvivirga imtechensis AK7 TaxID=1237149 RepID=L8JNB3_9BACT|nr:hypothetical protein C900_03790 [Fulvivirga imtechensis AK7]
MFAVLSGEVASIFIFGLDFSFKFVHLETIVLITKYLRS